MKFPQDFIDRVRESSNIVDVIGQFVQLKRSGHDYQGLCPFHNEKSPSFSVSETKQVYHCFGCKASGNVFRFVQDNQGLTFPETVEYLAKRASIPLPAVVLEAKGGASNQKQIFYKINGLAAQFFQDQLKKLPADHEVQKYLVTRGLTPDVVEAYKIGYAPDDWSRLTEFFESKKAPIGAVEQLGLSKRRTGGKDGHYDLFRHRLIFPIFSPAGECLGFGGRVFSKDQQPKYLNSPESAIFHKGRVFYGLDHSAKFIRAEDEAIIVEGYMDWLALAKSGIGNVVATLGTALTADHAKMVQRYTQKVLLLFDGDEAGRNAARRSLPILLSAGIHARGLFLPDQLDPDEFIEERGVAALKHLIQGAPDLFDLALAEAWRATHGSSSGKVQMLDEFAELLALTEDPRLKRLYGDNMAHLLDLDPKLVAQSVAKALQAAKEAPSARFNKTPVPTPAPPAEVTAVEQPQEPMFTTIDLTGGTRAETDFLNVILMKEVYLKEALASGVGPEIAHPGYQALFAKISEVYGQMPSKFDTLSALLADFVKPVDLLTRHLSEPFLSMSDEAARKVLQDCIKRIKSDYLRFKSKELLKGLVGVGQNVPAEQLEQIMNIHKSRSSLNRES